MRATGNVPHIDLLAPVPVGECRVHVSQVKRRFICVRRLGCVGADSCWKVIKVVGDICIDIATKGYGSLFLASSIFCGCNKESYEKHGLEYA